MPAFVDKQYLLRLKKYVHTLNSIRKLEQECGLLEKSLKTEKENFREISKRARQLCWIIEARRAEQKKIEDAFFSGMADAGHTQSGPGMGKALALDDVKSLQIENVVQSAQQAFEQYSQSVNRILQSMARMEKKRDTEIRRKAEDTKCYRKSMETILQNILSDAQQTEEQLLAGIRASCLPHDEIEKIISGYMEKHKEGIHCGEVEAFALDGFNTGIPAESVKPLKTAPEPCPARNGGPPVPSGQDPPDINIGVWYGVQKAPQGGPGGPLAGDGGAGKNKGKAPNGNPKGKARSTSKQNAAYYYRVRGTYGRYDVVRHSENGSFFEWSDKEAKHFRDGSDYRVVDRIKTTEPDGDFALHVLENKAVVCAYPEDVKKYCRADFCLEYAKTMYSLEDRGLGKSYWKMVMELLKDPHGS